MLDTVQSQVEFTSISPLHQKRGLWTTASQTLNCKATKSLLASWLQVQKASLPQ
jgi:hypothetical protein